MSQQIDAHSWAPDYRLEELACDIDAYAGMIYCLNLDIGEQERVLGQETTFRIQNILWKLEELLKKTSGEITNIHRKATE